MVDDDDDDDVACHCDYDDVGYSFIDHEAAFDTAAIAHAGGRGAA